MINLIKKKIKFENCFCVLFCILGIIFSINLFKNQNAPIIEDGVELYTNLFFGNDENALVKRIKLKYGYLPISNSKHTLSDFAKKHFSQETSN